MNPPARSDTKASATDDTDPDKNAGPNDLATTDAAK